jgi:TDG/mug DNA glycosylase family protein
MTRLHGLAPIVGAHTRLLVLGSFPSVASLRVQQYYAHPQNHFWKILQALWPAHPLPGAEDYAARCDWVLARGLGIWDVYASCEREGSLDSAIRKAEVNDFAALRLACPALRLIAHNGGESYKHCPAVQRCLGVIEASQAGVRPLAGSEPCAADNTVSAGLLFLRLPSTSPANASWSLERKLAAWRDAVVQAGLL